jgi:anti-sigma B factor antagonist
VTLALRGELDIATVDRVRTALADQAGASATAVVVDLHDLTFIDSSGVRLLLELNAPAGGRPPVRFTRPSPVATRLLELTGVGDLLSWQTGDGA